MPKKAEPTGFGPRLKELREAAGLSQQQLAERIGFHKLSVAKLEQGIREPTWSTVRLLAKALETSCQAFEVEPIELPAAPRGRPAKNRSKGETPKPASRRKGR